MDPKVGAYGEKISLMLTQVTTRLLALNYQKKQKKHSYLNTDWELDINLETL